MAFNISILSENSINNTTNIRNIVNEIDNKSYMHHLLELNDTIHDTCIRNDISFYRYLSESIRNEGNNRNIAALNEGIISSVIDNIATILKAIAKFLRIIIKKILGIDISKYVRAMKASKNKVKEKLWEYSGEDKEIDVFYYPNIRDIDSQKFRGCLNNLTNTLSRLCNGEDIKVDRSDEASKVAYKALSTLINRYATTDEKPETPFVGEVIDAISFNEMVTKNICFIKKKTMSYSEWDRMYDNICAYANNKNDYAKRISEFAKEIDDASNMLDKSKGNMTQESISSAMYIVEQIKSIVTSYTQFIRTIESFELKNIVYNSNMDNISSSYVNHIIDKFDECSIFEESKYMHGEEFDSDILFANQDLRDFNPTEWLDLELSTEFNEAKFETSECMKRIAINEAVIISDNLPNKFNRLIAMREAEEGKVKANIESILARIKGFITKFVETITEKFKHNASMINRNKAFINRPVIIRNIQSKGDIIAGMYRIQQKMDVIPYNYESMKEDLKDKKVFFKNKILPSMKNTSQFAKRKLDWNDDMSITDYCKAYYGASMPEDKYPKCEFTGKEIEINMQNIVRFLNQTNNIFTAKTDFARLENEAKKIANKISMKNTSAPASNETKEEAPKNESYYSILYNAWFTEAEIEMGEKPEGLNNQQNNSENAEEAAAYKNYIECYKDIILSKMTAAEFIASEMMQIVEAHVMSYMTSDQKAAERKAANGEKVEVTKKVEVETK